VIDHLRRKTGALNHVLALYTCAITAINLYELRSVPFLSDRQRNTLEEVLQITEVIPFNQTSAEQAAEVWNTLRSRGQLIGAQDVQIAGICIANHLPLLTRNKTHFQRVPDLILFTPEDFAS
jgi:tRNA(fMet)-specific endonuclease VapC